jgi:glycosyltransferase involved in cell wall biosynthesis
MKKIIILLSSYNGGEYLIPQLDSLLQQTVSSYIHILVRDDGSSDKNTLSILKKYEQTGKIELWERKNVGVVKSFFELLLKAPEADYYAFCDQDDYWLPLKIEMAIKQLDGHNEPTLYCSRKIIVDKKLNEMPQKDIVPLFGDLDVLMKGNIASGCTMVFNKSLRNLCKNFIPEEKDYQHLYHDTWLFTLAHFTGTIIYDSNSYILYRQHGNNVVGAMKKGMDLFLKRVRSIDWTLKKYKRRDKASYYASILIRYFKSNILEPKLRTVYDVSYARNMFSSRVKLFFRGGFSNTPLYEYIIYKAYILLGWL